MAQNRHFPRPAAVWAACAALACGGAARLPTVSRAGPALGAVFSVAAWGDDSARVRAAVTQAFDSVQRLDAVLSDTRPTSEIVRLEQSAGHGPQPVSPTLLTVVREALDVARATAGAVAPIAPAVPGVTLDSVQGTITVPRGADFILGRISRGFALDRALLVLDGAADSAILSLGGLYLARTAGPRAVGVSDPSNPLRTIARIMLPAGTWGVSAVSPVEEPESVEDPRTGRPAERASVVTVVGPRAAVAAAWSLAGYVLGCDSALALAPRHGVDLLCLDDAGARWTPGLDGRVAVLATDSVKSEETEPAPGRAPAPAAGRGPSGSTRPAPSSDSSR